MAVPQGLLGGAFGDGEEPNIEAAQGEANGRLAWARALGVASPRSVLHFVNMSDGTWRPRLHDELMLQMIEGEAVVLDRANERVHQLNEVGTFILERCDGRRTEAEIVAEVVDRYEVAEGRAARDTSELLAQMKALEILW